MRTNALKSTAHDASHRSALEPRHAGSGGGTAERGPDPYAALVEAQLVTSRHSVAENEGLTVFERALPALLDALQWTGQTRHLIAALPHVDPIADCAALASTLTRLGYAPSIERLDLSTCHGSKFPLFFHHGGEAWVAIKRDGEGRLAVVELSAEQEWSQPALVLKRPPTRAIEVMSVAYRTQRSSAAHGKVTWFSEQMHALRDPLLGALCLTLLINAFAVAAPLFSMFVYNTLIPAGAFETLLFATGIVCAALFVEDYCRALRGQLAAGFAGELHRRIMQSGLRKLFALPIEKIEAVSSTAQLAQLRRFESIVSLFHGSAAMTLLDLPFVLIFLGLIAAIAGPLALIPIAVAAIFVLLSLLWISGAHRSEVRLADARRQAQDLVRETVMAADAIRGSAAERLWLNRLCDALGAEADAVGKNATAQQMSSNIAQLVTALAATGMLATGALMALEGDLSVGALIAVIMLMWKVLAPFQNAFLSLGQIKSFREDVHMANQLMRLPDERKEGAAATIYRRFEGELAFDSVGFRYASEREFALRNVSFKLEPGETLGLMGGAGSGRSTLLRLAIGLHEPTIGTIAVDGLPLSQLDAGELRASFAFAPRRAEFFYGTVAQNIRLARNDVSDAEIEMMLEALEQPLDPAFFPEGLETRLTASARAKMGPATLQKLNLARAFLSRRPFLLLDDPSSELEKGACAALAGLFAARRGAATAIVASNEREILHACDKVMILTRGQVAATGAPQHVFASKT